MVFNATFNNSSDISWRFIVLLMEETGIPGENHRPAAILITHLSMSGIRTHDVSGL
jgi:hypothetical protein